MTFQDCLTARLATCTETAPKGGVETGIPGVVLFWSTQSSPPVPLVYEAGIVVLLQGRKHGELAGHNFVYDADNYLVLTLPVPFRCAHQASVAEPVCGFFIHIDREDLAVLLTQVAESIEIVPRADHSAVAPAPMDGGMRAASQRLLTILDDPLAAQVLGPALRREILFHVLRGPRGMALAALAQQGGDEGRLDSLIRAIRRDIAQPVSVEDMARRAGMSVSSFHRAFRAKIGQPPLQYVKRLRLHAARDLIMFSGGKVGDAARRVGYESTSQFCREYRRYFGESASDTRDLIASDDDVPG